MGEWGLTPSNPIRLFPPASYGVASAAISLPSSAPVRLPSGDRGCPPASLWRVQHGSGSSELTCWRTGLMASDAARSRAAGHDADAAAPPS